MNNNNSSEDYVFCCTCGKKNHLLDKFCSQCGSKIVKREMFMVPPHKYEKSKNQKNKGVQTMINLYEKLIKKRLFIPGLLLLFLSIGIIVAKTNSYSYLLDKGIGYYNVADYKKANTYLQKAYVKDRMNIEVLTLLIDTNIELENFEVAKKLFDQGKFESDTTTCGMYVKLSKGLINQYISQGEYYEALTMALTPNEEYATKSDFTSEYLKTLAYVYEPLYQDATNYLTAGRYEDARKVYAELLKVSPHDNRLYEKLLEINPNNTTYYMDLGSLYLDNKDYSSAINVFRKGYNETGCESLLDKLELAEDMLDESNYHAFINGVNDTVKSLGDDLESIIGDAAVIATDVVIMTGNGEKLEDAAKIVDFISSFGE